MTFGEASAGGIAYLAASPSLTKGHVFGRAGTSTGSAGQLEMSATDATFAETTKDTGMVRLAFTSC